MRETPAYAIETLIRIQVEATVEMAIAEGWKPGLADATTFHDADPCAFTGCITEPGKVIACISIVRCGTDYGLLGFYIVVPEWRERGVGLALWRAALGRARPIPIALDGVPDQEANYRRSGFDYRYRIRCYVGNEIALSKGDFRSLVECDPAALAQYDTAVLGIERPRFLGAWLAQPGAKGAFSADGERMRGYGLCRPDREGSKIGLFFANNDETARMARGEVPMPGLSRTWGITSFEFG